MWQIIKALREERGQYVADMKAILSKANEEKRSLTAEEDQKFNDLNAKAEQRKTDIERYERAQTLEAELADKGGEQRAGREDVNTPEQQAEERAKEVRSQFDRFLRGGDPHELRALTIGGQGVVGHREFYSKLVEAIKAYAGVRQAGAEIIPTSDGNPLTIPTGDDTANEGQIVGEGVTDNTSADPAMGNVTLGAHRFDSKWIKVSIEMLRDAAYPLEQKIVQYAGERIGRTFNRLSTVGTGTGQPQGFVTAAQTGKVAAANNAITYEELLDLVHSVDAGYRNTGRCRFQMHDTVLAAIRKLKDGSNRYIFAAGAAGAPGNILDYQYTVNNDMAQLTGGVNSSVVAFGDFSAYVVRDVAAPETVRANELFIGDGLVGFRIFSRHDGKLANAKAVKLLKLAAA